MDEHTQNLPIGRNLKIAFFHLGSGMADVLTTGVWNRIMISDLGFLATPIGLLVSLRYFLAPLGVWAGRMSDERVILGFRRLFWVWFGRAMMVISTFTLGLTTAQLAQSPGTASVWQWILLSLSLLLFSLGSALSSTPFLALIYDRAPEHQRGRAVGIVWTFLLLGFTVGGIVFGLMLPEHAEGTSQLSFTPEALRDLFILAGISFAGLWFFSLLGEERRNDIRLSQAAGHEEPRSIRSDLGLVWRNRPMRFFLLYLTLSMFFAFSQDLILEPFAGDVFGMEARITNRFAAYWGSTAIIGTLVFLWLSRKIPSLTNARMSLYGVIALIAAFAIFAVSSLVEIRALVTPGLIVLGVGLGIWNVGTLGLMMDMSPLGRAGTFLGFWTVAVTFARGFGVSSGGITRDLWLQVTGSPSISYGVVFVAGVIGLGISLWCLARVDVIGFKRAEKTRQEQAEETAAIFAGAMD